MRIAALVKQIPRFEDFRLGADGRLIRAGVELEMNPYCRRAVAEAVLLAAASPRSSVTVLTLGPPAAQDVLREAIAWAQEHGVDATGVHVCDPAFAGSDTLATAKALAAAIAREPAFDLVLAGRNSVDADTGQVGPQLAQLLGLPFACGARDLTLSGRVAEVRCEHDDGWTHARVPLPAIVSVAERLCDPAKVDPEGRAAVMADRIRRRVAADLGPGPWGAAGSVTAVGHARVVETTRAARRWPGASLAEQVHAAVEILSDRGALDPVDELTSAGRVPEARPGDPAAPRVAVLVEPGRPGPAREVLGAAAVLASQLCGRVVALCLGAGARVESDEREQLDRLASWGADEIIRIVPAGSRAIPPPASSGYHLQEQDVAGAVMAGVTAAPPWAILAPSTTWGREVAARVAAAIGAGLTGDAVDLALEGGRLVAWKPAFGGALVAAVTATSVTQMVTVRPGVLPRLAPRTPGATTHTVAWVPSGLVEVVSRTRDDDLDVLAEAQAIVAVGRSVPPHEYADLAPLLGALGAELGATRKVTDEGWLPRSRQIGITGRSVAPRLFVSIGARGSFNHLVGVRAAGTLLAVNQDPEAPVFDAADVGIVGDWREAVPLLTAAVTRTIEVRRARGAHGRGARQE